MSAIGSVIVMAWWPSSPWFPLRTFGVVGGRRRRPGWSWAPRLACARVALVNLGLPAGLREAGQPTAVRRGREENPAQPEPPVHCARAPAARAPGVGAHFELGLPLRLGDQRLLRHSSALSERES